MKKTVALGTTLTITSSALNYITQIIITEIAGFSARGQIEVIASIIALTSAIFSFNSYISLTLYSRKYQGEPFNLKNIFIITTVAQTIGAIAIFYFSSESLIGLDYRIIVLIITIAIVVNNYANINSALLNGIQIFISPRVAHSIGLLLTLISIVALIQFSMPSNTTLIYFASILPLVYTGILIGRLKPYYFVPQVNVKFSLKRAALDLWPVYIISIAQLAASRLFIIYVSSDGSLANVGTFAFANSLMQLGLLPMTMVATIIISRRHNLAFDKPKLMPFFLYLSICLLGYGMISTGITKYIPLHTFQNQDFIDNAKILIWILPFNAMASIAIAESVSKQRFSKLLIISQCATLPLEVLMYEICKKISQPNSIALAFSIATILVSILAWGQDKHEA